VDDEVPGAAALERMLTPAGSGDEAASAADDAALPVAATVVIARDASHGAEVLMLERPDRGSFAGAWVFPGGRIEPEDRVAATGEGAEADAARRAAVRETREETGLVLDAGALVPLSRWTPPVGVPLRIRTWFFAAAAPEPDAVLSLQEAEAVGAAWIRPAAVLERHGRGGITLYPPTWVTLHTLRPARDVEDLLARARLGGLQEFRPRLRGTDDARVLLYEGDAEYDDASAADGAPADASAPRHRLLMTGTPWLYERTVP